MKKIFILLCFLFFVPFSYADDVPGWDKTHWGMSKEEVLAIYNDRIREIKNNAGIDERIYLNNFALANTVFDIVLVVTDNKLSHVRLEFKADKKHPNDDFVRAKNIVIQKYGQPDAEQDESQTFGPGLFLFNKKAFWYKGKTNIELIVSQDWGVIRYLPASSTEGL